jgi:transcription termination factor 2
MFVSTICFLTFKILLLSLKAGGVGLNLMVANHLFLMDVHWNPQMEAQASDRVYRVGQKKTVNIYKFICSNTIEKRILDIQIKKLQIADNLFEGTSAITSKITLDDLKQIFQFQ